MPYEIETQDGIVIRNIPDDVPKDHASLKQKVARIRAERQVENDPITRGAKNFAQDMSGVDQFAAGVGKAIVDTGRGAGQLVGLVSRDDVAESRKLDAPLMDTGAGFAGDLTGNVAMTLLPGGALKGAAVAARAAGAPTAAGALSTAGGALLAPRTIKGAAAVGAGMGAIQPSTSAEETAQNVALGSGASAAIPVVGRALKTAVAAAEPLYEAGQKKILGRLYNRAAGDQAPAARAALEAAAELVPGSAPTAGQASGNAGIAALERTASAIEPAATVAHADRLAAQNAARVASLESVAGEPGKKAFFEAERDATAKQLYDTAYEKGIDITRHPETGKFLPKAEVAARKGEITKLLGRPAIQESIAEARKLAANEGVRMTDLSGSVQGLDYVQRALSDKISKATGNEQRILVGLRNRLLTTIDNLSPDYKAARQTFRGMSKPINQMEVGEEIANKAVNKLTGNLQPNAYARALSDDTAARATGFKGATLENTMEPEQLAKLQAVKDDLARAFTALNAGRGPGSDTVQKLAYSNLVDAAGVPTFIRNLAPAQITGNIAGRFADTLYGRANREMASKLAASGLDPKAVAELMKSGVPSELAQKVADLIGRGGASAGMMLPGVVNAQKQ